MDLIVRKIPQSDTIKVYPVSDVHLGSILHDKEGWQAFCRRVEREAAISSTTIPGTRWEAPLRIISARGSRKR